MTKKLCENCKCCYGDVVDEQKLYQNFSKSAAALCADALNRVDPASRQHLADALSTGIGELVLVVSLDPVSVIGTLRPTVADADPLVLFKIIGEGGEEKPSGDFH